MPPQERQEIVDTQRDDQQNPFQPAKRARNRLRIDFSRRRVARFRSIVAGLNANVRHRSLSAAARVTIDGERFDRHRIEPRAPGRHDSPAAEIDSLHDGGFVEAIEPDLIGEIWRTELAVALAVLAMTEGAVRGEKLV